jgi:hypothetical protein
MASAGAALAGIGVIWWTATRKARTAEAVPAAVEKPA